MAPKSREDIPEKVRALEVLYMQSKKNQQNAESEIKGLKQVLTALTEQVESLESLPKFDTSMTNNSMNTTTTANGISKDEVFELIIRSDEFSAMIDKMVSSSIEKENSKYKLKPLLEEKKGKNNGNGKFKIIFIIFAILIMFIASGFYYTKVYLPSHPSNYLIKSGSLIEDLRGEKFEINTAFNVSGHIEGKYLFFKLNNRTYKVLYEER